MVLEANSIKQQFIAINAVDFSKHSRKGENSTIISAANSYELAYNVTEYLFKADTDRGQSFVEALYDYLPDKYNYIYINYTNVFHATKPGRMLQEIWAFESEDEAEKYMDQIKATESFAPYSHIKQLPDHVDFDQANWYDEFEDLDFYSDELTVAKERLCNMSKAEKERALQPPARKLPEEFIKKQLSDPTTLSIGLKATEYNDEVDEYLEKRRQGKFSDDDMEKIEKSLKHRYNNFYHHLELNNLTSNLLNKRQK